MGPRGGTRAALPRFWFPGHTGTSSALLQKSSVVPSTASPSVRVLAVLAGRERGWRCADSGDTQPCGINDL